jgi:Raf kinase inhibitor-like YbhB/YbcL family protein
VVITSNSIKNAGIFYVIIFPENFLHLLKKTMKRPSFIFLIFVFPLFINCTPMKNTEITVSSKSFTSNGLIPSQYTCDGKNISPELNWTQGPEGTKTYALICDDPDAPMKTWVHWLIFNIPPTVLSIPEDDKGVKGAFYGTTDFRRTGYGGPCPPGGTHHYHFKLYALDIALPLPQGASKSDMENAMKGHILASGDLVCLYARVK